LKFRSNKEIDHLPVTLTQGLGSLKGQAGHCHCMRTHRWFCA